MSTLSTIETRKTRSTNTVSSPCSITSTIDETHFLDDLQANLHSSIQFINSYNKCYQIPTLRSSLIENLCRILANSVNVDLKILIFILDCFTTNPDGLLVELTDIQFKQDLLPFIKHVLLKNDEDQRIH